MTEGALLSWAGLLALGAWHGVNPAMGWLFAVALGVQEESGRAVWRALGPLALGHVLAVGAAVLVGSMLGWVVPHGYMQWLVAAVLVTFGVYRLVRRRHPRWVGMRVGSKDLVLWSGLMASAHGAGLMVLPFVLAAEAPRGADNRASSQTPTVNAGVAPASPSSARAAPGSGDGHAHATVLPERIRAEAAVARANRTALGVWATLVHAAAYLLVTGSLAAIVYHKLGLRLLRRSWLNLDVIWAATLILTGLLTPLLS